MVRKLLIGLFTVMIAAGISWVLSQRGSKSREADSSSAAINNGDRVAELEQEVARMKQELQWLSAKSNMPAQPAAEVVTAPLPGQGQDKTPANAEDPEVSMEKDRQAIAAKFDQLSSAIAREQRDPAWAGSAEKELGTVVQRLQESGMKGVTVLNSECKSSMCKVEVAYDNVQAQARISDKIRSPLFSGGEVRRYEENGQLRSTAYYYRQGYDRPL
jgi:hypothetical protein